MQLTSLMNNETSMADTKEDCVQKYKAIKAQAGGVAPKYSDFLDQAGINKRTLSRLFGSESYTKLQQEAGDLPNRLSLERTSIRQIMEQYASLVVEVSSDV